MMYSAASRTSGLSVSEPSCQKRWSVKGAGLGEEVFEGGLFVQFVVVGRAEAGIEILLKVGAEVHFFEGVGLFSLGVGDDLLGGPFALRLLAGDIVEQGNVFFQLLKTGFSTISVLIISFNSSLFKASTLTICMRPGVSICR